jgi:hypothetical protein
MSGWLRWAGFMRCPNCRDVKCEEEFSEGMRNGSNKQIRCRKCMKTQRRAWIANHREESKVSAREYNRRYFASEKGKAAARRAMTKMRAKGAA